MAKKHQNRSRFRHASQQAAAPAKSSLPLDPDTQLWQSWMRGSLIVFLIILPWLRLKSLSMINPIMTAQFFAVLAFSVLWLAAWLVGYWRGMWGVPKGKWLWAVGLWWLASTVATVFSLRPWQSLWGTYSEWSDGYVYTCCMLGLALGATTLSWPTEWLKRGLVLLLVSVTLLGLWATGQAFHDGWKLASFRIEGPMMNADYWLSYGFLFWPLTVALAVYYLRKREWRSGVPALLSTLIIGTGLFYALPPDIRNLTHIPGPVEMVRGVVRHKTENPASAPVAAASDLPAESGIQKALTNSSNTERFTQWKMGIQLGKWYPWHGAGPAMMASLNARLMQEPAFADWDPTLVAEHPHNETIEEYSRKGIPGVATYLVVWIGLFIFLWSKRGKVAEHLRPYWWGVYAGLVLYWLFNQALFTIVPTGITSGILAALLIASVMPEGGAAVLNGYKKYLAIAGSVVLSLALLWSAWWGIAYWRAEQAFASVYDATMNGQSLEALQGFLTASDAVPREPVYADQAGRNAYRVEKNKTFKDQVDAAQQSQLPAIALLYTQRAVSDDPYTPFYRADYGFVRYVYFPEGSAEMAAGEKDLKDAVAASPRNYLLYTIAGDAYAFRSHYKEAERMLAKAYELYSSKEYKERLDKIRQLVQK